MTNQLKKKPAIEMNESQKQFMTIMKQHKISGVKKNAKYNPLYDFKVSSKKWYVKIKTKAFGDEYTPLNPTDKEAFIKLATRYKSEPILFQQEMNDLNNFQIINLRTKKIISLT